MIKKDDLERLKFLSNVTFKEKKHLLYSNEQIFTQDLTFEKMTTRITHEAFAEKTEAFASRFGRFQDTIGGKLIPLWLKILGEQPTSFIDNLNKAEKLGVLDSVENWLKLRELRTQMVHEYIEDMSILVNALTAAHEGLDFICQVLENILNDVKARGYL